MSTIQKIIMEMRIRISAYSCQTTVKKIFAIAHNVKYIMDEAAFLKVPYCAKLTIPMLSNNNISHPGHLLFQKM